MNQPDPHRALAEILVFHDAWDEIPVTDSLLAMMKLLFTEEEANLLTHLGFAMVPARVTAVKARRPVHEVEPILESLSQRLLIGGAAVKGVKVYGLLPIWPGIFETLMLRCKTRGGEEQFYRDFARLFEDVYEEYFTWAGPRLANKDVRLMRIIPVGQSLEYVQGVIPLDTDRYSEIVDRNKSFCLVEVCTCRQEQHVLGRSCDKPRDVCSAMGVLADLAIEKGLARRVSKEEFLDAKARAFEAGLVNLTDNLQDPLQVCSCCGCCCGVLKLIKNHNIPTILAKSHFQAAIDPDRCSACGSCVEICPMEAITLVEDKARIDYARCIGCGLCVSRCGERALSLRERAGHKPPSENPLSYYGERYQELKGHMSLTSRLALGVGRLLGPDSRIALSGPRYKSTK